MQCLMRVRGEELMGCPRGDRSMSTIRVDCSQCSYEDLAVMRKKNIWRNGPYIGGHLAFFFQIEFQTRL